MSSAVSSRKLTWTGMLVAEKKRGGRVLENEDGDADDELEFDKKLEEEDVEYEGRVEPTRPIDQATKSGIKPSSSIWSLVRLPSADVVPRRTPSPRRLRNHVSVVRVIHRRMSYVPSPARLSAIAELPEPEPEPEPEADTPTSTTLSSPSPSLSSSSSSSDEEGSTASTSTDTSSAWESPSSTPTTTQDAEPAQALAVQPRLFDLGDFFLREPTPSEPEGVRTPLLALFDTWSGSKRGLNLTPPAGTSLLLHPPNPVLSHPAVVVTGVGRRL